MDTINSIPNNIPQFQTPHSGGRNKLKLFILLLAIGTIIAFSIFYYSHVFKKTSSEVPVIELPPTKEEKVAITENLSSRRAAVSNADKEMMIKGLEARGEVKVMAEDREASAESLYK